MPIVQMVNRIEQLPYTMEDEEANIKSAKKKKRLIDLSSSNENSPTHQHERPEDNANKRSSERIRKRQNRTFSMPSREERWKSIPTDKNPEREIRKLTPKKLVNNFTKENHRYNYDPVYTSGEESLEEFIDDELESKSSDSDSGTNREKKRPKRKVKNYHPRIMKDSSSESETDVRKRRNTVSSESDSDIGFKPIRKSVKRNSKCIETESEEENNQKDEESPSARQKLNSDMFKGDEDKNDTDSDVVAVDRNRNCIIDSDDDSEETDTQSEIKMNNFNESNPDNVKNQMKSSSIKVENTEDNLNDTSIPIKCEKTCDESHYPDTCMNEEKTKVKVETSVYDSDIKAENDTQKTSEYSTCSLSSDAELTTFGVPGNEIEPIDLSSDFVQSDTEGSLDSLAEQSESSESDIGIQSERTRILMVKKKRKKEKMFEQFREARELKLQREAERRLSETRNENVQNANSRDVTVNL